MDCPYDFDPEFLDDLPYEPRALFLDRIEAFDEKARTIVCRMPTDVPMPFTDAQRTHPVKHPHHVHVYYMLGLRHADGWTGYGTHVHRAVFRKLVPPGKPLLCSCKELRARFMGERIFVTYEFEYRHEGDVAYESKQSAMWIKTDVSAV
jgi:hypothetical protein